MEIFNRIKSFFGNHYWLFLVLVIAISYGQMLFMGVYRDDNALFFKLFNIEGPAGYLGRGIWGDGAYRFQVTPYWLLFKIVGGESAVPYYVLNLIFYFFSTLSVYKLFSELISKRAGMLSAFLFASGYIGLEGFNWLITSMMSNLSVILACWTLIFYNRFSQNRSPIVFLVTLLFFFLTSYIVPSRTHYFIFVVLLFEILIVLRKISLREIVGSLMRGGSFLTIFYFLFVNGGDKRSGEVFTYLSSILSGKLYYMYSFFGTIGYLFFPDRQFQALSNIWTKLDSSELLFITGSILLALLISALIAKFAEVTTGTRVVLGIFNVANLIWFYLAQQIAQSPSVMSFRGSPVLVYIGGYISCLIFVGALLTADFVRRRLLFLFGWLAFNIFVYVSLDPATVYDPTLRYMVHSFIPLVGLLALLPPEKLRNTFGKLTTLLVIAWGLMNLGNSYFTNNDIVRTRSIPVNKFYTDLKHLLPVINKGDLVYFSVSKDVRSQFDSAFRVGQMPEETALAWRYGLDRYDFYLATDFEELLGQISKNNVSVNKIHSYYYSSSGLIDTTHDLQNILGGRDFLKDIDFKVESNNEYVAIDLTTPISSLSPVELEFLIKATPSRSSDLSYPFVNDVTLKNNPITINRQLSDLAFEYLKYKQNFRKTVGIHTDSEWRENVTRNLVDGNNLTVWQPDRFAWGEKKQAYISLDLKNTIKINKLAWINAYSNNTPTNYTISTSIDGNNYEVVKKISQVKRIDPTQIEVVSFPDTVAHFVRVDFTETINQDNPGLSELWVIPSAFSDLDIKEAENYLMNPFGIVNEGSFEYLLQKVNHIGKVDLLWMTDDDADWKFREDLSLSIQYDGFSRYYKITLPARATKISKLRLKNRQIPGHLEVLGLRAKNLNLREMEMLP